MGGVPRVQVQFREDQQPTFREADVAGALSQAASVSVRREVESETRARLGDLAPESLGPLELLERYFTSRSVEPERVQRLLMRAEEMLRDPD